MVPSRQYLKSGELASPKCDKRLEEGNELIVLDPATNVIITDQHNRDLQMVSCAPAGEGLRQNRAGRTVTAFKTE
jgi:hypothetical protein